MCDKNIRWRIVPLDANIEPQAAFSEKQAHKLVRIALDRGISCDLRRNGITIHTYYPGDVSGLDNSERRKHRSWTSVTA